MTYLTELPYETYGVLAWYAMTGEAEASLSALSEALDNAGLRVKLSRRPALEQAFKKACASGVEYGEYHLTKATQIHDRLGCWINRDADDGEQICEGNYLVVDDEILLQDNGSQFYLIGQSMQLEKILLDRVEYYRNTIDSTLLRQLIPKHFLEGLGGIRLKSGLFFFGPEQCEHLETFSAICNGHISHSQMELLPMPKDTRQKEVLKKAFHVEITKLRDEFNAHKENVTVDNPTLKAINNFKDAYHKLDSTLATYNFILGNDQFVNWQEDIYAEIMERLNGG